MSCEGRWGGREGSGEEEKGEERERGKEVSSEGRREGPVVILNIHTCSNSFSTILFRVLNLFSSEALNSPVKSFNFCNFISSG